MTRNRWRAAGLGVAAFIGAATYFWSPNEPERGQAAYASDVDTAAMGAGPAASPGSTAPMWDRFEHEKKSAQQSELPPLF